uniref:ARAD1D00836p n=1 Tax=Blastobotrys adeninivorans TaxID=409370 RepID=A0A060T7N2_BLAAD
MLTPDDVDFAAEEKPFKSSQWQQTNRKYRYKNMKAVLADEQRRLASLDVSPEKVTYFSVDAPPSLRPRRWWCDITGLEGKYKSTRSGLRFYNAEVYDIIKDLAPGVDQRYLELRNANVVLR